MVEKNAYKIEAPNDKPSWKEIFTALPFTGKLIFKTAPQTIIGAAFFYLIGAPVVALRLFAIKEITDALTVLDQEQVILWSLILVGSLAVDAITAFADGYFDEAIRVRIGVALRQRAMEIVSKLPYQVIENPNYQLLADGYFRKTPHSVFTLINATFWAVYQGLRIIGSATIFILIPWQVNVILLAVVVIRIMISRYETGWSWNLFTMETREGRRSRYVERIFWDPYKVLPIKSWQFEKPLIASWLKIVNQIVKEKLVILRKASLVYFGADFLRVIGLAAGLWIMIPQAINGTISVGVIVAFLTGFVMIMDMLNRLLHNTRTLMRELPFVVIIEQFLTLPEEKASGSRVSKNTLHIEFKNVSFSYPGTDQLILKDITFDFHEGDRIAFVGLNGAGKSTLLKLLMGVYEPTSGDILINGKNLNDINPLEWRRALAVLNQDELKYDDTITEQIRYGDYGRSLNKKRLHSAIEASGFQEVVQDLPKGIETHAGKTFAMPEDEPIELSGGQKQLLSIARTLYRDARIYIFDEPTSAVDAEKEERFFRTIPEALRGRAVIYVSHRFSILRQAERIIVIDNGRIIEDGGHEDLMKKKGRYAELYELQAAAYRD